MCIRDRVCTDGRVPILGQPRQRAGRLYSRDQPQEQSGMSVLSKIRHGAHRPAGSAVSPQDPLAPGGGTSAWLHDMVSTPRPLPAAADDHYRLLQTTTTGCCRRPLPAAADDTSPVAPASRRIPAQAGNLRAAVIRPGAERGGCQSMEATVRQRRLSALRGDCGKTAGRVTPESADVRRVGGRR